MIASLAAAVLLAHGPLLSGVDELGSPREALDVHGFVCAPASGPPGGTEVCRREPADTMRAAGVPARFAVLVYRAGRLERATVAVDETHYAELLRALVAALGAGDEQTERLRAGMGGVFPNHVTVWRAPGRVIVLEQYFERVTRSALSVMSPGEHARFEAQREAQRVRGIRDL